MSDAMKETLAALARIEAVGIAGNIPRASQAIHDRRVTLSPSDIDSTGILTRDVGPSGASVQTYNDAGFAANIPSAPEDGLSIEDRKGLRVAILSPNGTIVSGLVRLWVFNGQNWFVTSLAENLIVGALGAITSEFLINVPMGRIYAELVGFTNSGGSGSARVTLQVF